MANRNMIKLSDSQVEYLACLPEQGMGYQIVDVELNDGRKLNKQLVFNCTFLQLHEKSITLEQIKKITLSKQNNEGGA